MTSKEALKIALHSEMKISTEFMEDDMAHLVLTYRKRYVDILVETESCRTYGVEDPPSTGIAEYPCRVLEVWNEEKEPIEMTEEELDSIHTKVQDYEL